MHSQGFGFATAAKRVGHALHLFDERLPYGFTITNRPHGYTSDGA